MYRTILGEKDCAAFFLLCSTIQKGLLFIDSKTSLKLKTIEFHISVFPRIQIGCYTIQMTITIQRNNSCAQAAPTHKSGLSVL